MTFLFSCEVGKSENTFSTTVSRPRAPPHEWLFFSYIRGEIQKHVFDKFRQISPFRHISPNFDKFRNLDRFRHHFSQIRQISPVRQISTSFFANSTFFAISTVRHHFSTNFAFFDKFRHHFSQIRHHFSRFRQYFSTNFAFFDKFCIFRQISTSFFANSIYFDKFFKSSLIYCRKLFLKIVLHLIKPRKLLKFTNYMKLTKNKLYLTLIQL